MKILHVVPSICNGGVTSILYNLTKSQRAEGHEVTIYVSRPQLLHKEEEFRQYGVNVIASRYKNRHNPLHIWEIKNQLPKYDLVHVHLFPDQFFVSVAYKLLPESQRPVLVTTEHNTYNNRRKISLLRYFDRWFYNAYDAIVNISDASKLNLDRWLDSRSLSKKSITIINGIDIAFFADAPDILREETGIADDDKVVIMVSRLVHPKDPVTLLKAISKCDENTHVVFIGYGPLEDSLKFMANDLGMSHRVHLLGRKESAAPYLKGCDIGVLSTYWDGFGLVAVEYMAAGLPVLASNVEGLRDVVGRSESLFEVGDYETLSKKITRLLSDNKAYAIEKEFFLKRVSLFAVNKMNTEYLRLYSQLMSYR